jgi:hypothetical protein
MGDDGQTTTDDSGQISKAETERRGCYSFSVNVSFTNRSAFAVRK